jgi:hypothetical protein
MSPSSDPFTPPLIDADSAITEVLRPRNARHRSVGLHKGLLRPTENQRPGCE